MWITSTRDSLINTVRNILALICLSFICNISSAADEWKIKNKWKVSCGIVDNESLVVNGKPKTRYSKNEFKLEKVKDKYLIKGYNDPYIDSTPSDCSSDLKSGKCLSMLPYCKGDMEKKYNSSCSETDDKEYIYKLNDATDFGNVGFVVAIVIFLVLYIFSF